MKRQIRIAQLITVDNYDVSHGVVNLFCADQRDNTPDSKPSYQHGPYSLI